jgi:hypothetical protein
LFDSAIFVDDVSPVAICADADAAANAMHAAVTTLMKVCTYRLLCY